MATKERPAPGPELPTALQHLRAGDWQAAHAIVQKDESALSAWLHGIVHLLEGDMRNAAGWYERAARPFPSRPAGQDSVGTDAIQAEIAAAAQVLGSGH